MPLEIKELLIKVAVGNEPNANQQRGNSDSQAQQKQLVKQTVEEVLRILEQKQQR